MRYRFTRLGEESGCAGDVQSDYSRSMWLPVLGPTAWLIWGGLADRLRGDDPLHCSLAELGAPWGFPVEEVSWSLLQLTRYGLAQPGREDHWQVATRCPPLPDGLATSTPGTVRPLARPVLDHRE